MTKVSEVAWDKAGEKLGPATERRRPGRPAEVNPALIPLLRGEYAAPLPDEPIEGGFGDGDDLGPLRGLAMGVGISAGLWGLTIWAIQIWI